MSAGWIAAALVSAVAHVGFVTWIDGAAPRRTPRPPIEMQLATLPAKIVAPPKVEPLPPPPPPPPVTKPVVVTKAARARPAAPPPPPEPQRVGIADDATTATGEVAVSTGVTTDGVLGTGTRMDDALPPPPPARPTPAPAPAARRKPTFVPAYEVTQLPKIERAAQPAIPDAFRQARREAVVVVEVEIDVHGRVVGARVLRHAAYGLDDAALAAAKATTFEPARMGTQPVPVRYQLPYRFKVRG